MREFLYNLATDKYRGVLVSAIKAFLFILSLVYGLAVRILILFAHFRIHHLNCKVISVGNITLGGTGKTSLVEYIARYLKQQGRKVAVLSRGYKRKAVSHKSQIANHEKMGDEPYMLSKKLGDMPVLVDANRIRAAERTIRDYVVDTVILDDGFQQWRIKKDLEIVAIDATNPFGNRHMLPRGILREPLFSLKRADLFILTKTNLNPDIQEIRDFLAAINPRAGIFESIHKPKHFYQIDKETELLIPEMLRGKTVTLFSGIGDPDSFENLIISLGIKMGLSFRFRDHYHYTQEDLDRVTRESKDKNIDTVITTEKDAVRLAGLQFSAHGVELLVMHIALEIKDEQGLRDRLLSLYSL